MVDAVLYSLTGKLLAELSSTTLKKAFERGQSNMDARKDLDKLKETIQTIHLVVLDAEKKQDSPSVKNWIRRVRDVLYEADDLSDDIFAADALLEEKEKEGNVVDAILSKSTDPIILNEFISKKVKDIRKSLEDISQDMNWLKFVQSGWENQVTDLRKTWPFMNAKDIFGRADEKKAIIDLLLNESDVAKQSMPVQVIAVVGIGGMGKTTLAQLVYNDEQFTKMFQKKWWACISDVPGRAHVLGRISDSMNRDNIRHDGGPEELIWKVVSSSGKYLLVLDDVWDFKNNDRAMWHDIMSLLGEGTTGSKIIVTTRFSSVPRAMQKDKSQIYYLHGLSEEKSWELFKTIAYTEEQMESEEWVRVGRGIVSKCANVPLAIKSIAGALRTKSLLVEWKSVKDDELLKMESGEGSITHALRLSYNHLPSDLKHCFAYCSLFVKDSKLSKQQLIHLWIAQGYCTQKESITPEAIGHGYFMELLRRCFFQEVEEDDDGEIHCKMHDLIHDLAQDVAREESIVLIEGGFRQLDEKIRHLSDKRLHASWDGPPLELKAERLRSLMFTLPSHNSLVLDQRVAEFKSLRTLYLEKLCMSDIPSCIGELRHLRYLNLSENTILDVLPDSITKLVNLLTLDLHGCYSLVALPNDFRKLISLRHLDIRYCFNLKYMPPRFGELTSLQQLSFFKVCKRGSGLDSLANMSLQGKLKIFYDSADELMEENSQIPHTLERLEIRDHSAVRVSNWWKNDLHLPQLVKLQLSRSKRVRYLPQLRYLPFLKELKLYDFMVLEYIEEEIFSSESFFRYLRTLELNRLPKLKGWSRQWSEDFKEHRSLFPHLAFLAIEVCPVLKSMPPSPNLQKLFLQEVGEEIVHQLVSTSTASLQKIAVFACHSLKSFPGEGLTSLCELQLRDCSIIEKVQLASNALQKIIISRCRKVELCKSSNIEKVQLQYEEHPERSSFPRLRVLDIDGCPVLESMSRSPYLQELRLQKVGEKIVHQLVSTSNASLQNIMIESCDSLKSFPGEGLTSLRKLQLRNCSDLEKVQLASNALQNLMISGCPKVGLCKSSNLEKVQLQNEEHPERSSFPHLAVLNIDGCPDLESMPHTPYIQELRLEKVGEKIVHQLVSTSNASLQEITISSCGSLKCFPGEGLTGLRKLQLRDCFVLEKVQLASNALQKIEISRCPKVGLCKSSNLEEVQLQYEEHPERSSFPHPAVLEIDGCPYLESMPQTPYIQELRLEEVGDKIVHQLVSSSHASLQHIMISSCHTLKSFSGEGLTSLRELFLFNCSNLEKLQLASNALRKLIISGCPKLGLCKSSNLEKVQLQDEEHPERSSFPHLAVLDIDGCPDLESISLYPNLEELTLEEVGEKIVHQLVSSSHASLQNIKIKSCDTLKSFPGKGLTSLRNLQLRDCSNLEKVQLASNALQKIIISRCSKEGLCKSSFPHPAVLYIDGCPNLESISRSPNLEELDLFEVGEKIVHQIVSTSNASLQEITISSCDSLKSFPGEGLTSLRKLEFYECSNLEKVQLASNALQELIIRKCPKVELWGHTSHMEENRGLHWASLTNLRLLTLDDILVPEQLPHCLGHRTALGKLQIKKEKTFPTITDEEEETDIDEEEETEDETDSEEAQKPQMSSGSEFDLPMVTETS